MPNQNTHGGSRPGSGRPPKSLKYAAETDAIDRRIVDALPEIIDAAIAQAKQGNIAAMRFLMERIFGRVRSVDSLSRDTVLPYTQDDFEFDLAQKQKRAVPGSKSPKSVQSPSVFDEIAACFRSHDRPTALDEIAASVFGPRQKEPSLIAVAR